MPIVKVFSDFLEGGTLNSQQNSDQTLDFEDIKDRISQIRKEKGHSKRWLAKEMGISYRTYYDFEANFRSSMMKYIVPFARALEINPVWVLNGDAPLDEQDKGDILDLSDLSVTLLLEKADMKTQMKAINIALKNDDILRKIIIRLISHLERSKKVARDFPTSEKL